ncbi:MAG: class I SAM-dependent methyltransferase [Gammaproteobacteria bacterium]|nr:class I SAM-dependent methyltransferase [Gammaproteobacteria bacterium]
MNSKYLNLSNSWASSGHARAYFDIEKPFLTAGLKQSIGPTTLQIGSMLDESIIEELDLPKKYKMQLGVTPSAHSYAGADLAADPAFLPFLSDSFNTLVLPHVLESHSLPHQVLREAHRVLMGEGYVVITGFNPSSLIGLQRWLRPESVFPGRYYTPKRVIDWLHVLGFEVVASSMFHYAPASSKSRARRWLNFLESIGDRWLPMFGGGYMIVGRKKEFSGTLVERSEFIKRRPKLANTATAYVGNEQTQGHHKKTQNSKLKN